MSTEAKVAITLFYTHMRVPHLHDEKSSATLNWLSYFDICYFLSPVIVKGAEVWFSQRKARTRVCERSYWVIQIADFVGSQRERSWERSAHAHYFPNISASRCNISLSPTSSDSAIIINFHIIVFLLFEKHKIKHLLMPLS